MKIFRKKNYFDLSFKSNFTHDIDRELTDKELFLNIFLNSNCICRDNRHFSLIMETSFSLFKANERNFFKSRGILKMSRDIAKPKSSMKRVKCVIY